MAAIKRLLPSFNRVLVEKIVLPKKSPGGILLPETSKQLNSGKVVAVGPGERDRDGKLIPVALKEGDHVLLPEYGGLEVKLAPEKEYLLFRENDILVPSQTDLDRHEVIISCSNAGEYVLEF